MYQYTVADSVENYWFSVLTEMYITERYTHIEKRLLAADVMKVSPNIIWIEYYALTMYCSDIAWLCPAFHRTKLDLLT